MNRLYLSILALMLIPFMHACVATTNQPVKVKRDDPLIGKIIDSKKSKQINFDQLIKNISQYDVIYLSEKHDNPDMHQAQNKIINALYKEGKAIGQKPSVGFEFFSMDQTPVLLNFIDAGKKKHSEKIEKNIEKTLRMKLGWHTQSNKMWKFYYDLLKTAQTKNLQVAGLDLSSTLKRRITKKGIKGITALEKTLIFSTNLSDPVYQESMFKIFKAVHCGMGGKNMQSRLYDTWLARNDKMALSITQMVEHGNGPVVVIVGGGHTEFGLGIIDRVNTIDSQIKQINIGLTEITKEPSLLKDYLIPLELKGYKKVPAADYLWFFQRVSYDDPCERFKESLEKMRKNKTKNKPE